MSAHASGIWWAICFGFISLDVTKWLDLQRIKTSDDLCNYYKSPANATSVNRVVKREETVKQHYRCSVHLCFSLLKSS